MTWDTSTRRDRLPPDWQVRRRLVLARDQHLCHLRFAGCLVVATEVDHIVASDDHDLANLHAVCQPCHALKTAAESARARAVRLRTRSG